MARRPSTAPVLGVGRPRQSPIPDHPTPRKSATVSYGLCNPGPTSAAYINETLSYGTCIRTPERTRKSKCSLFPSCREGFTPVSATKRPHLHFCNQLHFSVHPNRITNEGIRPRPYRGAHVCALMGSYALIPRPSHFPVAANRRFAADPQRGERVGVEIHDPVQAQR